MAAEHLSYEEWELIATAGEHPPGDVPGEIQVPVPGVRSQASLKDALASNPKVTAAVTSAAEHDLVAGASLRKPDVVTLITSHKKEAIFFTLSALAAAGAVILYEKGKLTNIPAIHLRRPHRKQRA